MIDHWWQTETGWAIASNCTGLEPLPIKAGSSTKPVPEYCIEVLNANGTKVPPGTEGMVAIKLPLPPGSLLTLWQDDQKFLTSYLQVFNGYYFTGDGGYYDQDGYLYIMGRIDDVINVAGHRLSTGAMEEILAKHPEVAECAVVGRKDSFKGQLPLGFIVLKSQTKSDPNLIIAELVQMVRDQIGAIASFKETVILKRLPKTRSGKILRGTIRKIADGEPCAVPPTIDDPAILKEIEEALKRTKFR